MCSIIKENFLCIITNLILLILRVFLSEILNQSYIFIFLLMVITILVNFIFINKKISYYWYYWVTLLYIYISISITFVYPLYGIDSFLLLLNIDYMKLVLFILSLFKLIHSIINNIYYYCNEKKLIIFRIFIMSLNVLVLLYTVLGDSIKLFSSVNNNINIYITNYIIWMLCVYIVESIMIYFNKVVSKKNNESYLYLIMILLICCLLESISYLLDSEEVVILSIIVIMGLIAHFTMKIPKNVNNVIKYYISLLYIFIPIVTYITPLIIGNESTINYISSIYIFIVLVPKIYHTILYYIISPIKNRIELIIRIIVLSTICACQLYYLFMPDGNAFYISLVVLLIGLSLDFTLPVIKYNIKSITV